MGPLSHDSLRPNLLGALRELRITDGSVKSLCMPTAYSVLPEPGLPGPEDPSCPCRDEELGQSEGSTGGAFCPLVPGLRLAQRRDPVNAYRVRVITVLQALVLFQKSAHSR